MNSSWARIELYPTRSDAGSKVTAKKALSQAEQD